LEIFERYIEIELEIEIRIKSFKDIIISWNSICDNINNKIIVYKYFLRIKISIK